MKNQNKDKRQRSQEEINRKSNNKSGQNQERKELYDQQYSKNQFELNKQNIGNQQKSYKHNSLKSQLNSSIQSNHEIRKVQLQMQKDKSLQNQFQSEERKKLKPNLNQTVKDAKILLTQQQDMEQKQQIKVSTKRISIRNQEIQNSIKNEGYLMMNQENQDSNSYNNQAVQQKGSQQNHALIQHESFEQQNKQLQKINKDFKQKYQQTEQLLQQAYLEIAALQKMLEQNNQENQNRGYKMKLKQQIDESKQQYPQYEYNLIQNEINQLKQKNKELSQQITNITQQNEILDQEKIQLANQLKKEKQQLQENQDKLDIQVNQNQKQAQQIELFQAKNNTKNQKNEVESLAEINKNQQQEIKLLRQQINKLKDELDLQKTQNQEIKQLKEQLERNLEEAQSQLKQKQNIQKKAQEMEQIQQKNDQENKQNQHEVNLQKIQFQQEKEQMLLKQKEQSSQLELKIRKIQDENRNLLQQIKILQEDSLKCQKQKSDLQEEHESLKNELITAQLKCEEYQKQIRKIEMKVLSKEYDLKQIKNHQNEAKYELAKENVSKNDIQQLENQISQGKSSSEKKQAKNEKHYKENVQKDQLKQVYSRKSLTSQINEYKHNENIKKVILELKQKFDTYRSVRGDGNCYFRAVGFSFLEHLCRYSTPVQHLEDFINKMESDRGYYQIRPNNRNNSHQILKQTFLRLLNNLKDLKEQNQKFLQQYLEQEIENNKDKQDEALVWQMRCLTANYLESHREYFESFCQISYEELITDILTMGKEADGLAVGPLQVVFQIKIDIITIDRNYPEALQFDQMKISGKCPLIYILYKPGHYDIIYSKDQSLVDGFDESTEKFQDRIKIPAQYDILNPGKPFFIEIAPNGQESPLEEFKPFKIQYVVNYKSTSEVAQDQKQKVEQMQREVLKFEKCVCCSQDYEQQAIIKLKCNHYICRYCLED